MRPRSPAASRAPARPAPPALPPPSSTRSTTPWRRSARCSRSSRSRLSASCARSGASDTLGARFSGGAQMAVRTLLHYALEIPDQTVGEKFYRSFGLIDELRRDGAVHLRPAPLERETV